LLSHQEERDIQRAAFEQEAHRAAKQHAQQERMKIAIEAKPLPRPGYGIGGAPNRATTLPDDPQARKKFPVSSGVLDYFPDALLAISEVSWLGNEQHNPGQPLHWARGKSSDEENTMLRHYLQRGTRDTDGARHTAKAAWRLLAILQKEIEAERTQPVYVGHNPDGREFEALKKAADEQREQQARDAQKRPQVAEDESSFAECLEKERY
jgi:hypothetical protein